MWWIFLSPGQFLAYRTHFGTESVERVAAWLVSTLAWLVTAVPILAYTLGTIQRIGSAQSGFGLFVVWVLILAGWFLAGWLAGYYRVKLAALTAFVITVIATLTVGYIMGK